MPNLTIEHHETKEQRTMSDVEFRNFMRKEENIGHWQVTATEVVDRSNEEYRTLLDQLEKERKAWNVERARWNALAIDVIEEVVKAESLQLPIQSDGKGGQTFTVTPYTIIERALAISEYTKSFADAIKVVLTQCKIAWRVDYDRYDDDDDR